MPQKTLQPDGLLQPRLLRYKILTLTRKMMKEEERRTLWGRFWRLHKQIVKGSWDSFGEAWEQGLHGAFRGLGSGPQRTVFSSLELTL